MQIDIKNSRRRNSIADLISRWLINAFGLLLAANWLEGVVLEGNQKEILVTGLLASAVLGAANATIKPILILLTLPISILTLGLFTLVINAIIFNLVSVLVPRFGVMSFEDAFWGSLLLSLVNLFFGIFTGGGFRVRVAKGGQDG